MAMNFVIYLMVGMPFFDLNRIDESTDDYFSDYYGIIDSIGNLISRPIFNEILPYRNGVAWVRQNQMGERFY